MTTTPTWDLPLPDDGQTPWGNDYRTAMLTIDARLFGMRGSYYALDKSVGTNIGQAGTAVKANVDTTAGPPCQFCTYPEENRLTYIGPLTRTVTVWASVAITSGNNKVIEVAIRKNGQDVEWLKSLIRTGNTGGGNAAIVGHVELATNDYLEVWLTNRTSTTSVTVVDLTLAARG